MSTRPEPRACSDSPLRKNEIHPCFDKPCVISKFFCTLDPCNDIICPFHCQFFVLLNMLKVTPHMGRPSFNNEAKCHTGFTSLSLPCCCIFLWFVMGTLTTFSSIHHLSPGLRSGSFTLSKVRENIDSILGCREDIRSKASCADQDCCIKVKS